MRSFNPRAHAGRDATRTASASIRSCFNPRAHAGRDEMLIVATHISRTFQSTRPRGARRWPEQFTSKRLCFNPRAHAGRDQFPARVGLRTNSFNPRAHAGRDGNLFLRCLNHLEFQSTRPRGARLTVCADGKFIGLVSIHAPTRGATAYQHVFPNVSYVSIHAPTRGATLP